MCREEYIKLFICYVLLSIAITVLCIIGYVLSIVLFTENVVPINLTTAVLTNAILFLVGCLLLFIVIAVITFKRLESCGRSKKLGVLMLFGLGFIPIVACMLRDEQSDIP